MDVALPDGSGLDLVAGVRASDRRTPVLIMSGHVDERRLVTAHRLRAAYLLKPLDLEESRRFALAVRDELALRRSKIDAAVRRWKQDYGLTAAEATVVLLGARGVQRFALAADRGVAESTIKTQVERLLAKTGDDTFEAAANRLLREVIGES